MVWAGRIVGDLPDFGILRCMTDVELDITEGSGGKAVIEGKTSVPFRTFVTLILQRRVQVLFQSKANDPVIVGSDLLTALASAPSDRQEDTGRLVLVTFGVGILAGVFIAAAVLLGLQLFRIPVSPRDLGIVLGVIGGVALLGTMLQRQQRKSRFVEKLHASMEKAADLFSK